jgi:hypothetical protein
MICLLESAGGQLRPSENRPRLPKNLTWRTRRKCLKKIPTFHFKSDGKFLRLTVRTTCAVQSSLVFRVRMCTLYFYYDELDRLEAA